jgi:branched-chain amino acid transport system ATP-binding protein
MNYSEKNAVLHLDKVTKSFGGLQVLSDVDIKLEREEFMGLIGPNGAGKSTLFNVITSIYKPDSGDVFLRGQKITGLSPYKICHMGIARTFQLTKTFLKMTVLGNVMVGSLFGRKERGKGAKRRALEALELVELYDKKDLLTEHITLSDRRLLEIAMALAATPVVTLLDEPMAGLNPSEINQLLDVVRRAKEERKLSILWIEHKVEAVLESCDTVVVLDHGLKIADGRPKEIANNQKVMEAYLGEPAA